MAETRLLTPRMRWVLTEALRLEYDSDEPYGEDAIVQGTPGGWYVGTEQFGGKIGWALLRLGMIDSANVYAGDESTRYYRVTEDARRHLADPSFTPRVVEIWRGRLAHRVPHDSAVPTKDESDA